MTRYEDFERKQRQSFVGLDGFSVAVSPLPYEFEEFNLQISSKKVQEQLTELVKKAGITTLNREEYATATAPGSLGINVELLKTEDGTYIYSVRALVTQLAVLERDLKKEHHSLYAVITWMSPRLRTGEVSTQLFISRITEEMKAVTEDFISDYKRAASDST